MLVGGRWDSLLVYFCGVFACAIATGVLLMVVVDAAFRCPGHGVGCFVRVK